MVTDWIGQVRLGLIIQAQRETTVEKYSRGKNCFLISTDLCARGIDICDITHVFNYDMPFTVDTWVHRIGRTGRAGARGSSITLFSGTDNRVASDFVDMLQMCDHQFGTDLKWLKTMAKIGRIKKNFKKRIGKR